MSRWILYVLLGALALLVTGLIIYRPWRSDDVGGQVILRVANWGSPMVDPAFMQVEHEIWGGFERQHPGVKLQIEQIPGLGQYNPKLIMQHVAGVAPDVVSMDMSAGADFINNDILLDLRPYIENDPDFKKSDFFDLLWRIASRDGKIYAVPLDFTPMVMFYNKKMFDRAGVPYPREGWTWAEFADTCRKLTIRPPGAARPTQWGFFFENHMPFWMPWLWSDGAEVVSPDGSRASGFFDGPKAVETVQFLADLVNEGVLSHPRDKAALGVDFFLNEQAAMDLRGHWWLIDLRSRGIDVGVTTIPTNTGKPATVIYFTGLSIMKQCRQPDLAWKYIKYATSEPVQTKRVKSGLAISGNRLTADHYAGNPVEDAFLHAMEFARPPPGVKVESYAVCEDIGKEAMDNILFNGVPVQKALTEAARLMDAALYTGSDTRKADEN